MLLQNISLSQFCGNLSQTKNFFPEQPCIGISNELGYFHVISGVFGSGRCHIWPSQRGPAPLWTIPGKDETKIQIENSN